MFDEVLDGLNQFFHAAKHSVADPVMRDFPKPAFDDVQPRTAGRRVVDMESLVPLEPRLDLGMLVRRVVVDDQVQVQFGRSFRIDFLEKLDPFLVPMPRHALADDPAFRQFDGREQSGCAVASVVVSERLQPARKQRQALLRPIEGLNLTSSRHTREPGRAPED